MENQPRRSFTGILILGILLSAGGLLFGGVDRVWQIVLLFGLFAGMCVRGASWNGAVTPAGWIFLAAAAVWMAAEFLPVSMVEAAFWRRSFAEDYGLELGGFRNPSPANVLDAVLMMLVAVVWYAWVRQLMRSRGGVEGVAWAMLLSAALFAAVCLWMRTTHTDLIYGHRDVAGWQGFGPFPNRNHSANLLAMGFVLSVAVSARCLAKRTWLQAGGAVACALLLATALVVSGSRGAVIACAAGLAALALLLGLRMRRRVILSIASGIALVIVSLLLLFGGAVLERFRGGDGSGIAKLDGRADVWSYTMRMIEESPLLGHGAASFPMAYPFHQEMRHINTITLHPESSFLLWSAENGVVVLLLALTGLCFLIAPAVKLLRDPQAPYSFYRAGAFAVMTVALTHALFDVVGHRWGTFFFALTAVALLTGCGRRDSTTGERRFALPLAWVPLLVAGFWALPFFVRHPVPTPLTAELLLAESVNDRAVPVEDVEKALKIFPLHTGLHELAGNLKLQNAATRPQTWKHFQIVNRLHPDSWSIPAQQAMTTAMLEPGMALNYWTEAIDRSGTKADETLNMAVRFTANFPNALDFWTGYALRNPRLLLPIARLLEDEYARPLYRRWKQTRLKTPELQPYEIQAFYELVGQYGSVDDFLDFMEAHLDLGHSDLPKWVHVLAGFQDYRTAWAIAAPHLPPASALPPQSLNTAALQRWLTHPDDLVNARTLIESLHQPEQLAQKRSILETITARESVPPWFLIEAARAAAADNDHKTAIHHLQKTFQAGRNP